MSRLLKLSSLSIFLTSLPLTARAKDADIVVIHPEQEAKYPAVATDTRDLLHVTYTVSRSENVPPQVVYTSSSDGKEWKTAVEVSDGLHAAAGPAIVAGVKGEVVIAWPESAGEGRPDVFASASSDGGKTWSKPVDVSRTPQSSGAPALAAAPDGSFHLVWSDTATGEKQSDIWHSKSTDGGRTWSKPENVSRTPGTSTATEAACGPSGEIAVVWADSTGGADAESDIWLTLSNDGGATWAKATNLSNTPGQSENPTIAIDAKGAIYVAWDDASRGENRPDIFFLVSRDGGRSFEKSVNVSQTEGISSNPEIFAEGDGHVAIAWVDLGKSAKTPDIWFASSVDGGRTFSAAKDLTNTPGLCSSPDVVISRGRAFVVWQEVEKFKSHVRTMSTSLK